MLNNLYKIKQMFDKSLKNVSKNVENGSNFVKKWHILLTFVQNVGYTFEKLGEKKMIDVYDSETLIKIYRMLKKKCDAIDNFIKNHALYFGPTTAEYGALDVCNNIIELMARKNQLINLKLIVDNAVSKLNDEDKKILALKMNYTISMTELCGILEMKQRTAFRKVEKAYSNLALILNKSKYLDKLMKIMNGEDWIVGIKEGVKAKREAYHGVML